ncbi:hypothetical protein ACOSP7_016790 [Xanthoceras sorbifolium]
MASSSIPQFYCDYNNSSFASDFYQFSSYTNSDGETTWGGGGGDHHAAAVSSGAILSSGDAISIAANNNSGAIWGTSSITTITDQEISFPLSNIDSSILQPESPPAVMPWIQEQLEMLDSVGPTLLDYGVALFSVSGMQNCSGVCCDEFGDHHHDHEYCYGFVQDFKPVYPSAAAAENWAIQNNEMPSVEDTNTKVGRYSVEERKDRIFRYLKKKNKRNFKKTIKYECRKTLADRRVRVRGRFARNSEQLCEEDQMVMKNNNGNNIHQKDKELYCTTDAFQMKQDEEWLQEAMASVIYLPYITG